MLRVLFYVLAAIAFVAPMVFWAYLSAMACAFQTSSNNGTCGVELSDFWDSEFLSFAIVPWAAAGFLGVQGFRIGRKAE